MKRGWLFLCVGLALLWARPAAAHKPSDSYLVLDTSHGDVSGHWDLALRDLDRVLTLDADGDGDLTWGELRTREAELDKAVLGGLTLLREGKVCSLAAGPLELVEHSDGRYARLPLSTRCPEPSGMDADAYTLRYDFFFDLDPQHRSVIFVRTGTIEQTFVLGADKRELALEAAASTPTKGSWALIEEGVGHILSGLDHVLFLLALLLPSVLRRSGQQETTGLPLRSILRDVFKVVTAFTVAHSLTLGLAALGLVSMSASVIEPAIAASVAIAALDNLWPIFGDDRWSIAFALGLLHGFGFSSALSDLGLTGAALLRGLFAFNLGVELGQLALVSVFVPVAYALRNQRLYRSVLLRGGSLAIAALSVMWFVDRVRGG